MKRPIPLQMARSRMLIPMEEGLQSHRRQIVQVFQISNLIQIQ